ncbi:MAG: M48 family metallopeptidase [Phenylobacterium sp.]
MFGLGRPYADGDLIEIDGLPIRLKVSPRSRRIALRLDRVRREVVASAPDRRGLSEAVRFARSRTEWIRSRLADAPSASPLAPGLALTVFDRPCRLEAGSGRTRLIEESGVLIIRAAGEPEAFARSVVRVLKREALVGFRELSRLHCDALGAPLPKVAVTDTQTRWGSCTPGRAGTPPAVRYVWRLALAPYPVADYVAAHECAHILEPHHGPAFWALVRGLVGDPAPHRDWLRREGPGLQALGAAEG